MTDFELDLAALTDVGMERDHNEDACGIFAESEGCAVVAVADGVSMSLGGEVASQMAVEVLLRAYCEQPAASPGQRLYRAFQQANIEIYDRSLAVPELRGMATTLTAVTVDRGELIAVHAGDSRLYLLRAGEITQLTKDHTVAAEKVRYGLLSKERARNHPDSSVLTRSVGRELIVSRDRVSQRLQQGDFLLLCSDGLYNMLDDPELAQLCAGRGAAEACRALVEAANSRRAYDNLTAAVVRLVGPVPEEGGGERAGLGAKLRRIFGGAG